MSEILDASCWGMLDKKDDDSKKERQEFEDNK